MSALNNDYGTLPDDETIASVLDVSAYYLYAIGRPKPGAHPVAAPIVGVDRLSPVRAVGHGPIVALVSNVSLAEFDLTALEQRLQQRHWLELLALGHQRVMGALLDHYTLLPLKLCTLYLDEGRIYDLLEQSSTQFAEALDRLQGTNEWGVKLFCNRSALTAWAEREAPQLRQLAATARAAGAGARYLFEKRLSHAAQQLAEELMRTDTTTIAMRLADLSRAAQRNRPQPASIHGRSDEMTLNGAYLVGDAELERFLAGLTTLREQYGPRGFSLELTGPWPAYSFSGDTEEA